MEKKLKVVIIGIGYWGKNFLRLVIDSPDKYELMGVVDNNADLIDQLLLKNVKKFNSIDELLLSDLDFDSAIIATTTSSHFKITKKLLERKINCLVEKPLTTSYDEACKLYKMSEDNEATLLVDHTFLYDASILELKRIIDEGELGEVIHLSFERTNLGPVRTDTNAAWDLSTHDLSILYALISSSPEKIQVSSKAFLNEECDDIVNISLGFNNVFATLFSSWLHPEKSRIIKVVGTNKMAVWNGLSPDQELRIYDKGVEKQEETSDYSINIYKIKSGSIKIPNITRSEPLRNVVFDFYNRVNSLSSNDINDKKLTLKTIQTMEEVNRMIRENASSL